MLDVLEALEDLGVAYGGAVRDHTAVIRQTVLTRVVGDGVVGVLRSLAGYQLQRYQGYQN